MSFAIDVYLRSPVWLQNVLVSTQGLRLRYQRYGSGQQKHLKRLLATQWNSREQIAAQQLRMLRSVVSHAVETVSFYKEHGLVPTNIREVDDLRKLPIVQKDDLRLSRDVLVSGQHVDKRLTEVHTGGTTGKPLTIYCDRATLQHNFAFFGRLRIWAGIGPGGKTATFAGRTIVSPDQQRPPYWRRNLAANTLLFSSYHISSATIPDYVRQLSLFKPDLIDSYPSSIEPIARYLLERGITSIRPRAVITSSETLNPTVRAWVQEAFGCRVFDYYGGAEMAAFVSQCEQGSYHVNPEFGIVEILRDGRPALPGETGEIVATGFINPVMPLIRYATGDVAAWATAECTCGRAFPTLTGIEGRKDDVIITPEGRRIGRLDPIFKAVASIYESQIVQDKPDHVEVQLVASALPPEEEAALIKELRNRLGPSMRIDIVRVQRIQRTAGGKLRTVVNLVSEGQVTNPTVLHE
jgi:phenylacetate-CoA ligase